MSEVIFSLLCYVCSIMNSLVIVLFLSGMVAMIMLRTLHKDIARYNQIDNSVSITVISHVKMVCTHFQLRVYVKSGLLGGNFMSHKLRRVNKSACRLQTTRKLYGLMLHLCRKPVNIYSLRKKLQLLKQLGLSIEL